MKRFSRIFMLVLSLALLAGALVIAASAATATPKWTQEKVIAVYADEAAFKADKADGVYNSAKSTFNCYQKALDYCKANGAKYVALTGDWECGENTVNNAAHKITSSVTLDLNGYTMSFSVNLKNGSDFTWNTMMISADNLTYKIVGNGGTINVSAGLLQHNNSTSKAIIDGGNGGITIRSITGYNCVTSTSTIGASNTSYPGNYMVKLGNEQSSNNSVQSPELTLLGDIRIEKNNKNQRLVFNMVGNPTLNIGTEERAASVSYRDLVNTDHANNLHGLINVDYYASQTGVYAGKTVGAKINITNADIDLYSEKLLAMTSKHATYCGDDDVTRVVIKDSDIYAEDYDGNPNGYSGDCKYFYGLMYVESPNNPIDVYVSGSTLHADHGQYVIYCGSGSVGKTYRSRFRFEDSTIIHKSSGGALLPLTKCATNVIYKDCHLVTDGVASLGALWRPYSASDTAVSWPQFVKNGEFEGIGILVESGCSFSQDMSKRFTNCNYKMNHGIVHTCYKADGVTRDPNCTGVTTAAVGTYTGKNYFSCSITDNDANAVTVPVYDIKTNTKVYMAFNDATKHNFVISDTGIKTFDGVTAKTYKNGNKPSVEGLSWTLGSTSAPRCGSFTVTAAKTYNGEQDAIVETSNRYVIHEYWANDNYEYSVDPYFTLYTTGLEGTFSNTKAPVYSIDDYQYYTVDFDLMTPTGEFTKDFKINAYFKSYNTAGNYLSNFVQILLSSDGKWTINGTGGGEYAMEYLPGKWQHITLVLEMPVKTVNNEKVVDLAALGTDASWNLFIDGELKHTFKGILPSGSLLNKASGHSTGSLDGKHPYCALQEVRTNFTSHTSAINEDDATAIDNYAVAKYPARLGMTLTEAAEYMSDAQAALGIEQPTDLVAASYGSTLITSDNMSEGLDKYLKGYFNGSITDTLTLYTDFQSELDLLAWAKAAGVEFTSFEYISNGGRLAFPKNKLVQTYDDNAKTYTVTKAPLAVKWYNVSGEVLRTDTAFYGDTLSVPVVSSASNGWYVGSYLWKDASDNLIDGSSVTVSDHAQYYCYVDECKADFGHLTYNIKLYTHVGIDFYIAADKIPAEIKSIKMYTSSLTLTKNSGVKIGGKEYLRFTGLYSGATSLHTDYDVTCEAVVATAHGDVTLKSTVTVGVIDYLQYVTDNHTGYASMMPMVADMLQYSYELYRLSGQTVNSEVLALYNATASWRTNLSTAKVPTKPTHLSAGALTTYVSGFSFVAGTYAPAFKLTFKDPANTGKSVLGVTFRIDGYLTTNEYADYGFNAGYVNYGIRANKGFYETYSDGSYKSVQSTNIPIHNVNAETVTIILKLDDGTTVSGTYSLDAYYYALDNSTLSATGKANFKRFILAINAYSESAAKYRFGGKQVHLEGEEVKVYYSDFGAVGDGVANDFFAIRDAHAFANTLADAGYKVKVCADPDATYRFGKGSGNLTISVKTDTDWQGATLIFDDSDIASSDTERAIPIFTVDPEVSAKTVNASNFAHVTSANPWVDEGDNITTNIGWKPGVDCMLLITNSNKKQYVRYGPNANSGSSQQEIILVKANGDIDPTTPLQWSYDSITSVRMYSVNDTPITLGNAYIIRKANVQLADYKYYDRNIMIQRSNTILENIEQIIVGESDHIGNTDGLGGGDPYNGTFYVRYANKVTIRNVDFQGPKHFYTGNASGTSAPTVQGSYGLGAMCANEIHWYNVHQTNYKDANGVPKSLGSHGTNYCKNMRLTDSGMSLFDAHKGTYNAYITNSELISFNMIGEGEMVLNNVSFVGGDLGLSLGLRNDYGSTWKGKVSLTDCKAVLYQSTTKDYSLFRVTGYVSSHDFGYACYFPEEVILDNFTVVDRYGAARTDVNVHLCTYLERYTSTDISVPSSEGGGGGINPYYGCKKFTVTNCPSTITWILPDTLQFKDMVVTVGSAKYVGIDAWKTKYGASVN